MEDAAAHQQQSSEVAVADSAARRPPAEAENTTATADAARKNQANKSRRRNKKKGQQQNEQDEQDASVTSMTPSQVHTSRNQRRKKKHGGKQQTKQGGDKKDLLPPETVGQDEDDSKPPAVASASAATADTEKNQPELSEQQRDKKKAKNLRRKQKRRENKKKFAWRAHLPDDDSVVDPITLEPLKALRYPPFALVATEPYEPVPEWPVPDSTVSTSVATVESKQETEQERQRRILAEQWGETKLVATATAAVNKDEVVAADTTDTEDQGVAQVNSSSTTQQQRHYHLFDGRALAYYMVSTLQFIDPLNRRDLTREELVNLDEYLGRHGFGKSLNVVEAFDAAGGITISTAGAAASTAAGRATRLQQLASNLLNDLFYGGLGSGTRRPTRESSAPAPSENLLLQQYQDHEQARHQQIQQQQQQPQYDLSRFGEEQESGIYGSAGLRIIDDDLNPGLRGNAPAFYPSSEQADGSDGGGRPLPQTLWSASHVTARYGHAAAVRENQFPSLQAPPHPAPPQQSQPEPQQQQRPLPASKTLARISKTVKKTDPEEMQRQFEAREEARKKAMLSNMTYGSNPAAWDDTMTMSTPTQQVPATVSVVDDSEPSESQIERNRKLAEALGVAPSTVRASSASYKQGWARPTEGSAELDAFRNELSTTTYPDSLILQARERIAALLKLEKKWQQFLQDDAAPSLSLQPMDRPMRAFVHEYSDYWKLQTESYDPEPRRYIHCVKLRDTSAPYPLLSEAARNWRGPSPIFVGTTSSNVASGRMISDDHSFKQTAGQATLQAHHQQRYMPVPERTPLPLKQRSATLPSSPDERGSRGLPLGGGPTRTMTEASSEFPPGSRFADLSIAERPKLNLQKRTLPLELPPVEQKEGFDISEELRRQQERAEAKARKQREKQEREQAALEAAFASDDEGYGRDDDSGDWHDAEQEPLYTGSDDDE